MHVFACFFNLHSQTLINGQKKSTYFKNNRKKQEIGKNMHLSHHTPETRRLYSANASSKRSLAVVSPGTLCEG